MSIKELVKRVPVIGSLASLIYFKISWLAHAWDAVEDDDLRLIVVTRGKQGGRVSSRLARHLRLGHLPGVTTRPGMPYFGSFLRSKQGSDRRHFYMRKTLESACTIRDETQPIKILEIGSWAGSTAITLGKYIKSDHGGRGTILCVDSWDAYFNALDTNKQDIYRVMNQATDKNRIFNLFLYNVRVSGLSDIVIPMKGKSTIAVPLLGANFDYAFIDASHYYDDVIQDIQLVAPLIKVGGVLAGDDLEFQVHEVEEWEITDREDEDCVPHAETGLPFHPGVTRAVKEVFGEVSSWEGHWAMRRTTDGWEKIEIQFSEEEITIPDHLIP